jgi:two-component system LytT family response regulator
MNCVLIDDEQHNLENLKLLLEKHCPQINVLGMANAAQEGFTMIAKYNPDLVFLDIEMPEKNGFDLLEAIPVKDFEVIFVTAYNQYMLQAIKSCALDYIMKPIAASDLTKAVARATEVVEKKRENEKLKQLLQNLNNPEAPQKIALPTAEELFFVPVKDIIRCQGENNYTRFYLTNGKSILVSRTLKEWDDMLVTHEFIRTHQSHLINSIHVKSYVKKDGGYILMNDGSTVCVSKSRKEDTLSKLTTLK